MTSAPGALPPTVGPVTPTAQATAINAWLEAFRTLSSAPTAPTTPALGQIWTDTSVTPNVMRQWTGSAWAVFGMNGFNAQFPDQTTNVNTIPALGVSAFRSTSGTAANAAGTGANWVYLNLALASNATIQLAVRNNGDELRMRRQQAGTWTAWFDVITQKNILGTVSQVSGVPTGAVIERGSNANGEFVRWADGTQICTGGVSDTTAISTAFSYGGFQSPNFTWTFPAAFVAGSTPRVNVFTADAFSVRRNVNSSATEAVFNLLAITSQSTQLRSCSCTAIGRWF